MSQNSATVPAFSARTQDVTVLFSFPKWWISPFGNEHFYFQISRILACVNCQLYLALVIMEIVYSAVIHTASLDIELSES